MRQAIELKQYAGYGLVLVRIAWCAVALLAIGLVATAALSLQRLSLVSLCANCDSVPGATRKVLIVEPGQQGFILYMCILCIIFALSCLVIGGILIWHKADNRIALFASFTLTFLSVFFCNEIPTLSQPWLMLANRMANLGITCLFLFFCLFPTGKLTPWWCGGLAILDLCYWGGRVLSFNLFAHFPLRDQIIQSSLIGSLAVVQIYRYRRTTDRVLRRQTKWVVFGACSTVILYMVQQQFLRLATPDAIPRFSYSFISETMFFVALLLIPISIGIAILHSHLWNIDLIIRRTLVYGILSACVVGLYILVVGGLGTLFQGQGNALISLLATGLIAVVVHPLRERLQRAVNYLVYGERNDPYRVLSRLSQRLEATLIPDAVLSTIVETVAQAFKLPYAAITLKQGDQFAPGAAYGRPAAEETLLRIALTYQGELLGELILSGDSTGEAFSETDRRLLEDLARHAGVALHSVRLSAAVQRSREQLVVTREEERRRLRRDLHDGLGPQLASLMLMLTTVRKMLRGDPDKAEGMLTETMAYMQEAISDIRRLVYGLRPPALDDLGLLAALQEDTRRYHACGTEFTLVAPEQIPTLPAAVEVACYRVAQEALTNVITHAHARHCTVQLAIDETLELEVTDDGRGLPGVWKNGIGLTSMRERARELGGTCIIATRPTGGTRVHLRLPLGQAEQRPDYWRKETWHGAHSHTDR